MAPSEGRRARSGVRRRSSMAHLAAPSPPVIPHMAHRLRSQNRRRQLLIQRQRLRQGRLIELLAVLGSIVMLALAARTLPMVIAQREWVWLGVIVLLGLATGLGGGLQARALLRKRHLGNASAASAPLQRL